MHDQPDRSAGFADGGPFGDPRGEPHSVFMKRWLRPDARRTGP